MSVLSAWTHELNTLPIKIPVDFSAKIEIDPKVHMEIQGMQNNQNSFEKVVGLILPNCETVQCYYNQDTAKYNKIPL